MKQNKKCVKVQKPVEDVKNVYNSGKLPSNSKIFVMNYVIQFDVIRYIVSVHDSKNQ